MTIVQLSRVDDRHIEFMIDLYLSDSGRARFGGQTPSRNEIMSRLWDSVLAQHVVELSRTRRPVGLVVLSSPSFSDRYCYFSMMALPEYYRTATIMIGAGLAFDYAFNNWDFRKIYCDVLESNLSQFASVVGSILQEEGRLAEHHWVEGRYEALVNLSLYRQDWFRIRSKYSRFLDLDDEAGE